MATRFHVAAESNEVLAASHLVEEMKHSVEEMEMFPVLIGEFVAYFHDIEGGYHRNDGYHVVNLVHRVQGPGSPPHNIQDDSYEVHTDDEYFWLEVDDIWEFTEGDDYPDSDYVLSLQVTGYESGPYTFNEKLRQSVDRRETEYEHDG